MTRRLVAVSLGVLVLLGVGAAPAGAHAQLVATDPLAAAVVDESPSTITLRFTEPVEASLGAVRLYDGARTRIDVGAPQHPDGDRSEVRVDLPELSDGSYVATWRVISGDSHPVQGAFTFQIGPNATANVTSLAEQLLAEQGGDRVVGIAYGIDRFLVFASIAVLVGGLGFITVIAPSSRTRRLTRIILWTALAVCAASTAAGVGLQGAYAAGLGLADAFKPSLVRDVLDTQFGRVSVVRLALLVVVLLLLRSFLSRGEGGSAPRWWPPSVAVLAVAIAATPGLGGHATSGDHVTLAIVADALHVLAMSLWLGGLVFLVAVLLRDAGVPDVRAGVTRFSRLALGCVITLIATGSFQSWRQLGSLEALRDTEYGQLLVVKIVLVAGMVVVAAFSREIVYRLYYRSDEDEELVTPEVVASGGAIDLDEVDDPGDESFDDPRELRRLRRSVAVEVLVAVVVLSVTAMLVNTPPGRAELSGPFTTLVQTDELSFDVIVAPGSAGPNDLHLTALTPGGGASDPLEMSATMEFPGEEIAPIEVPLRKLGPGHYLASGFNVPIAGEWRLEIRALVSEVDEVTAETPVPIR